MNPMARKKTPDTEGPKAGDDMDSNADELRTARAAGQDRLDGQTLDGAQGAYNKVAGDYAMKAQAWKDAQEVRLVREDDLVKVHTHKPFDTGSAARVAKECAKSIQVEKAALVNKQEAKKSLDAAWETVRSFMGEKSPVQPLIADDEDE